MTSPETDRPVEAEVSGQVIELNKFQPSGKIIEDVKDIFGILKRSLPPGYDFDDVVSIRRYIQDWKRGNRNGKISSKINDAQLVRQLQTSLSKVYDKILMADNSEQEMTTKAVEWGGANKNIDKSLGIKAAAKKYAELSGEKSQTFDDSDAEKIGTYLEEQEEKLRVQYQIAQQQLRESGKYKDQKPIDLKINLILAKLDFLHTVLGEAPEKEKLFQKFKNTS